MMGWYGRMQPPPKGFWAESCPARAADLIHRHDSKCSDGHSPTQCCECGRRAEDWRPPEAKPEVADHLYMWTIAGKCLRCGSTPDLHPTMLEKQPAGECSVDHGSISHARLINDGGIEWRRCPVCNSQVEPKLVSGIVNGSPTDPGRGELSVRQKVRLPSWKGWVKHLGGDGDG